MGQLSTVKWEVRQPRGSEVESAQGKNNYLLEINTDVYSQEKKSRSQTSLGECRLEGGYSLSHSEKPLCIQRDIKRAKI